MLNSELELVISNLIAQAFTITPNLNVTDKIITLTVTATLQVNPTETELGARSTPIGNTPDCSAGYNLTNLKASYNPWELTKREQEVIGLVSTGLRDKEIAQKLCIEARTVSSHLRSIREKMEVNSRFDVALLWQQFQREAR